MSAEVGVGFVLKVFWSTLGTIVAGIVGHLWWTVRRKLVKLDNTYTKEETQELVDLKLEPTKQKVDTMVDLLHTMNDTTTKTNESIESVGTGIAVLQNDMEHLKEDVKELKQNKKDK